MQADAHGGECFEHRKQERENRVTQRGEKLRHLQP